MKTPKAVFALITLSVCAAQIVIAAELEPATLVAWNTHLDNADVQLRDRVTGIHPFLWVDESQERVDRVRRGDVVVGPMEDKGVQDVPHDLVHDWIGAILVPGAHINEFLAVVHDYEIERRQCSTRMDVVRR